MTELRTVGLVMLREMEARRRAFLITLGAFMAAGAAAMIAVGLATEGGSARLTGEEADQVVGTIGVIALFLAMIITGGVILSGVAEEKSSRVVEVVLGTMRPRHLLAGKILAMGLVGFVEMVLTAATVLVAGEMAGSFEVPAATTTAIVAVLVWFVLGFAFFSSVYGAAGALVRRHENSSNAAGPLNMLLSVGYAIGVISAGAGDSVVLRAASLFPSTAPFTMPVRMVRGTAPAWEIGLSIALILAGSYALIRMAGRVYAGALLRTGKVTWREAWRAAGEMG